VILKFFAAIGAGFLATLTFWGLLVVVTPSVPAPPAGKIDPVTTSRDSNDSKVRDVTDQPHTTAAPQVQPATAPEVAAPPAPRPQPAMAAEAAAAPEPHPQLAAEAAAALEPHPKPEAVAEAAASPAPRPRPATTTAAPSPILSGAAERRQQSAPRQFASEGRADDSTEAIQPMREGRQPHAARCTRYRTYDEVTQSYRGYDGLIHPCRP